jgi:hypothetical protein
MFHVERGALVVWAASRAFAAEHSTWSARQMAGRWFHVEHSPGCALSTLDDMRLFAASGPHQVGTSVCVRVLIHPDQPLTGS